MLGSPPGIDSFLRSVWVIEDDPVLAEYVRAPTLQMAIYKQTGRFRGDCDDASTLAAALLGALEWPAQFIAIRMSDSPEFSHVFVRAPMLEYAPDEAPRMEFDIDPIVPATELPLKGFAEEMRLDI